MTRLQHEISASSTAPLQTNLLDPGLWWDRSEERGAITGKFRLNKWRCEQGSNLRGNIPLLSVLESPDRLMIETDAPYLATEPVSVYDIAVELTGYFNMSTSEIIRVCNRNVAKLYNLPW